MNAHCAIEPHAEALAAIDHLAGRDDPRRSFLRSRWFSATGDSSLDPVIVSGRNGCPILALPLTSRTLGPVSIQQVAGAYWPFRGAPLDRGVAIEDLAAGLGSFAVRRALGSAR